MNRFRVLSLLVTAALCAACLPILGSATPETTEVVCHDGSTCPNPYLCPAVPGKRCEAPTTADDPTWGGENMGGKLPPYPRHR